MQSHGSKSTIALRCVEAVLFYPMLAIGSDNVG